MTARRLERGSERQHYFRAEPAGYTAQRYGNNRRQNGHSTTELHDPEHRNNCRHRLGRNTDPRKGTCSGTEERRMHTAQTIRPWTARRVRRDCGPKAICHGSQWRLERLHQRPGPGLRHFKCGALHSGGRDKQPSTKFYAEQWTRLSPGHDHAHELRTGAS